MKINGNLDVRRNQLLEEINELAKQKAQALQEFHLIQQQIADQRTGKNEVFQEQVKLENNVQTLEQLKTHLESLCQKEQAEFYKLTTKQREQIISLSTMLNTKIREWEEYKEKEKTIIDIDEVNRLHKESMNMLNAELQAKKEELASTEQQKDKIIRSKELFIKDLQIKEASLRQREEKVSRREKDQELREKRWKDSINERKAFINLKKK